MPHPVQRCWLAEDLVRLRRSDEQRRYVAPQRSGHIDANPHQIEAVIFALERLPEGGCILADEVGLGKTIEAGLVIRQLLSEGATRILLIAPKPLLGQWQQELCALFDIETREGHTGPGGFDGTGVFLIGRESAGSERGHDALLASGPFDLCVIDEAHEYFGGLYQRFDRAGEYRDDSRRAQTADRVRDVLRSGNVPVLLLTATPMQNSLDELWSLIHLVDSNGTLLGDLPTFRALFQGDAKRTLAEGQEEELRGRLRSVLQRTLRRQAQEFLDQPFVERYAKKFVYRMGPRERALYDDVTRYLLEPGIIAFRGGSRQLLLTLYHRQLASSTRALSASLAKVAARLRRLLAGAGTDPADAEDPELRRDLEETDEEGAGETAALEDLPPLDPARIRAELERVESFVRRADELRAEDGKFDQLLKALQLVNERASTGKGSGKVVIFTESLRTQEYLRDRLLECGSFRAGDLTLFRGQNEGPEAQAALARWREVTPQNEGTTPSPDIAVRLALVHEFRTRSKVFISTEAGAKGLNLQFCETVVNYDLPWNPQRIEQRIGRCHRYGQKHSVLVINFVAGDNEAQQLTFEILSEKLDLFGQVLDASDQILHSPTGQAPESIASALGPDLETSLRHIWERARSLDEVHAELRALRERVGEHRRRFEETCRRTNGIIENRFDEKVRQVFRKRKEELPDALRDLDADLQRVVEGYLRAMGIPLRETPEKGGVLLHAGPSELLPEPLRGGVTAALGSVSGHASLHLGHPLVAAAVQEARQAVHSGTRTLHVTLSAGAPEALRACLGGRARWRHLKVRYDGFEKVEQLVPIIVPAGAVSPLPLPEAGGLLEATLREGPALDGPSVTDGTMDDATDELLFALQPEIDRAEEQRFERAARQVEQFLEDRLLVLRRRLLDAEVALESRRQLRDTAVGSERRTAAEEALAETAAEVDKLRQMIGQLERGDDTRFRRNQERLLRRRYTAPRVELLFDVELVFS